MSCHSCGRQWDGTALLCPQCTMTPTPARIAEPTMSLRDWFAGQALTMPSYLEGVTPWDNSDPAVNDALWRYHWADAMLAERERAK